MYVSLKTILLSQFLDDHGKSEDYNEMANFSCSSDVINKTGYGRDYGKLKDIAFV